MDGSSPLGSIPLSSGIASYVTSSLLPGTHNITAAYQGDTECAGSTSSAMMETIIPGMVPITDNETVTVTDTIGFPALIIDNETVTVTDSPNLSQPTNTTTAVTSSQNPAPVAQAVTFTAIVSGPGGTPTGLVTFKDGVATIGSGTLSGGTARMTTSSLAGGSHSITAVYSGDAHFTGSTSAALIQGIGLLTPTVVLTSSGPNPSVNGQLVPFGVTVSGSGPTPTGTATILVNGANGGLGTLSGGGFGFGEGRFASGSPYSIGVRYNGDSN